MTPPIEIEGAPAGTPDVPSSSPGIDAMDISPLPHKMPYFAAQVTLPSPSPEATPLPIDEISTDLLLPQEQPIAEDTLIQEPIVLQLPEYAPSFAANDLLLTDIHIQTQETGHTTFAVPY